VTLNDSTQEVCYHPDIAEWLTGCSWRNLKRAGRVSWGYPCLCLSCGKVDPYELPTHKTNMFFRMPSKSEHNIQCRTCGERNLYQKFRPFSRRDLAKFIAPPLFVLFFVIALKKWVVLPEVISPKIVGGISGIFALALYLGLDAYDTARRKKEDPAPLCPICRRGKLTLTRAGYAYP
jgi:hypothetical protein